MKLHAPAHTPDDEAIALFLGCHARIRRFSELALKLATAEAEPALLAQAADDVYRYFSIALPLHASDEETLLLPRLRAHPLASETEAALEALHGEHAEQERLLSGLLPRWSALASAPTSIDRTGLEAETRLLREDFERHLAREEAHVFPAARRWLTADDQKVLAELMRARRAGAKP